MMRNALFLLTLSLSAMACHSEHEVLLEQIQKHEAEMKTSETLDLALAQKLEAEYHTFVKKFPEDSLAPHFLLNLAKLREAQEDRYAETVDTYRRLVKDYPESTEAPEGLIASALYFEAQGQTELARGAYRLFLKTYPEHPLRTSAEETLKMMEQDEVSTLQQVQLWKAKADRKRDSTEQD